MKISNKVECGIIAILDIAVNSNSNEIITVKSIAERHRISIKYLEQIIPLLRQSGLIKSKKGSKGGYVIAKSLNEITFADILNALDSTILEYAEFDKENESDPYVKAIDGVIWKSLNEKLFRCAAGVTLEDAVMRCRDCMNQSVQMYYI